MTRVLAIIGSSAILAVAVLLFFRGDERADGTTLADAVDDATPERPVETAPDRSASTPTDPESTTREASSLLLRVTVVLADAPLAGAEVHAIPWSEREQALAARSVGLPASVLESAHRVVTNEDGTAELPLDDGPAPARFLAVRGPGSGPGGFVVPAGDEAATLVVPPEQIMFGSVWTWPDPQLLPDATVFARRAFHAEHEYRDEYDPIARVAGMFFSSETVTDEGGLYHLGGLPASRIYMQGSAPGRSPSRRENVSLPSTEPITVSLLAGGVALAGVVVDEAGAPVEGVMVTAISRKRHAYEKWDGEHVLTGEDGRFHVVAPVDGDQEVGVTAALDGFETQTAIASNPPGEMTIVLAEGAPFVLSLRDEEGAPVSPADVVVYDQESKQTFDLKSVDEDGTARTRVSAGRTLHVLAWATGYDNAERRDVAVADSPLTLVMPRAASITGKVLGRDGAPIAGARVRLRRESHGAAIAVDWAEVDPDAGTYASAPLGLGDYTVDAFAPGFAPVRSRTELEAGEEARLDFTLSPGVTLRGVVRAAESGSPIAGARVGIVDEYRESYHQEWMPGETTTDTAGAFTLADVAAVQVELLVEHADYVRKNVTALPAPDGAPVDIPLDRPATLTVRLADPQGVDPIGAIRAYVGPRDGPRMSADGEDGVAVVTGIPPGRVSISCVRLPTPDRTHTMSIGLAPGEDREVVFSLQGGATLHGVVRDPSGLGFDVGALFVAVDLEDDSNEGYLSSAFVRADGSYRFENAPTGDVAVVLRGRQGPTSIREIRRLALGEGDVIEADFDLAASGLAGQVTNRAGRGVEASISVRTTGIARSTWTQTSTGGDGAFRIHHPPASIDVAVSAAGFGRRVFSRVISDRETVLDERVVLDPEARLDLRVIDVDGDAIEGVTARLTPAALPDAASLFRPRRVDDERLRFTRLAAGRYTLEVSAPDHLPSARTLDLAVGQRRVEKVRLGRSVDLALTFADEDGRHRPNLSVHLVPAGGDEERDDPARTRAGTTDAAGVVWFLTLPEGTYAIFADGHRDELVLRREGDAPVSFLVTLD